MHKRFTPQERPIQPRVRGRYAKMILLVAALASATSFARADGKPTSDDSLTMYGITLYGTVDLALQYQTHGTPASDYNPAVTQSVISKNSNHSITTISANQLSISRIGIKGLEELGDGWSGVFRLETIFSPHSGNIGDSLRSITKNNGVPLDSQTTYSDSAIAGELFGGAAYAGVTHGHFGTLTVGRQTTLIADGLTRYDPTGGAQGFALIGRAGIYGGGGAAENKRLDRSARYEVPVAGFRLGALFQTKSGSNPGTADQFALGYDFAGGSVDAVYAHKDAAIASAPLTAAQVANVSKACAGVAVKGYACASSDKALAGTGSDNTAWALLAKYSVTRSATAFAGYEHMENQNPSNPLQAGQENIGGYVLVTVTNAAYPKPRTLGVYWAGLKYMATPNVELAGAYYRSDQNSYATGANAGCSSAAVSGQCSGSLYAVSFLADYRFNKHVDVYGGAMYSAIRGGPANGFLYTSTVDPTIGVRCVF